MRGSLVCVSLAAALAAAGRAAAEENPIVAELTTTGVVITDQTTVPLPAPSLVPGLSVDEQQKRLTQIAAIRKLKLSAFTPNAIGAPHAHRLESVKDADGKRIGRRLDFWFVAYGHIETIADGHLFGQLAPSTQAEGERSTARALKPDELAARQLEPQEQDSYRESYLCLDFPILEKVQVSGLCFAVQTHSDEHVVAATQFDPKLAEDEEFPSQWQSIAKRQGVNVFGEPQPYAGFGGYAQATRLEKPEGALLIEVHAAFSEPYGWFQGKDLLGAKLPAVIEKNVRSFREKLRAAEKRRDAEAAAAPG